MRPEPSSSDNDPVRRLFERWISRGDGSSGFDIEELCRRHPEHDTPLRRLHDDYAEGMRALAALPHERPADDTALEDVLSTFAAPRDAGSFRTVDRLATGGMSEIERVWDARLQRTLARKVLPIDTRKTILGAVERRRLSRFLDEARIASQLQHPGILTVHEAGVDAEGRAFFVMPIVRGEHFGRITRAVHDDRNDAWTLPRALLVLVRVCEAMSYAHDRGVIHRDLKPANILVGRFGETYVVDWGLAKIVGRSDERNRELSVELSSLRDRIAGGDGSSTYLTMEGDVVGTPAYMAPEQAAGQADVIGKLADVYAMGAVLYELLTGVQPYRESSERSTAMAMLEIVRREAPAPVHRLQPGVPPELAAICDKAMARDPDLRYPDMESLADDLRAFLEQRVVRAFETGALAEMRKWARRNRVPAIAAAVGLLTVIGGLGIGLALQGRHREQLGRTNAELREIRGQLVTKVEALRRSKYANDVSEVQRVLAAGTDVGQVQRLLTACDADLRGWEWHYLNHLADASLRTFVRNAGRIKLAMSPDGKTLAASGDDNQTVLWDTRTGERLRVLQGNVAWIEDIVFSPSGRRVATTARDRWVRVFDTATGAPVSICKGHTGVPTDVVFVDEARVASVARKLRIWDAASGSELLQQEMGPGLNFLAVAGKRGLLAGGSPDGRVRFWDVDGFAEVGERVPAGGRKLCLLQFNPDGSQIHLGFEEGVLATWDVASRSRVKIERFRAGTVSLSPDGRWLLAHGDEESRTEVIDRTTGSPVNEWHCPWMTRAVFAPDTNTVYSGGGMGYEGGSVRQWSLDRPPLYRMYRGLGRKVHSVTAAPDGAHVAGASDDGRICIWKTGAPDVPAVTIHTGNRPVNTIAYSPDGKTLASVGAKAWITLWDAATGEKLDRIEQAQIEGIDWAAWSPDGRRLVAGPDNNKLIVIWTLPFGTEMVPIEAAVRIAGIGFLPDGGVVTGDHAGWVRFWDGHTGKCRTEWRAANSGLKGFAASPDGRFIATGWGERHLALWQPDGKLLHRLEGHTLYVIGLRFSADNRRLFSTGFDDTVRVWDTDSGRPLLVLQTKGRDLLRIDVSRDGRVVVAGGYDGVVHGWVIDRAR